MVRKVEAIARKTLRMILEASRDIYPREFGAFLRAEEGVITELVMIPGTVSGRRHAIFQTYMLPSGYSIVGTVHSHPSGVYEPSDEDRSLFSNFGGVHIIVGHPYTESTWAAWTSRGERYELKIVT
ncbi:MAG TPA: Mov34/MPN/PAD-1 family protein [Thermoplasmata archaeon]|jgi:proteasome lid subunit RPN8/RPN11